MTKNGTNANNLSMFSARFLGHYLVAAVHCRKS